MFQSILAPRGCVLRGAGRPACFRALRKGRGAVRRGGEGEFAVVGERGDVWGAGAGFGAVARRRIGRHKRRGPSPRSA